ncbi:Ger(x)C family spore germination protein [Moorellaceae bacterium AZ2]
MGKRTIFFLVLAFMAFLPSGCWDRREINELAFVSSMAADLEGQQRFVTVEIIRAAAVGGGGEGGGGGGGGGGAAARPQRNVVISSDQGDTILAAARKLATKLPRRVYVAHTTAVLVGEDMARQGLLEVLDFLDRHQEFRRSTLILLTRGPARQILVQAQGGLEAALGREILGLNKWVRVSGYGFIPSIHEVLVDLSGGAAAALIPVVEFSPQPLPPLVGGPDSGPGVRTPEPEIIRTLALNGAGLFHHDKLVGWLDQRQVRGWAWVRKKVGRAILELECQEDKRKVSVEITEVKSNTKMEVKNGQMQGQVKIRVEGNLLEQQCFHDLTTEEALRSLEGQIAALITAEISSALGQAQQVGADVFDFGGALFRKEPRLWKQVQTRWDEEFKKLPVAIQVEARVRRTGLTSRPWQPQAR